MEKCNMSTRFMITLIAFCGILLGKMPAIFAKDNLPLETRHHQSKRKISFHPKDKNSPLIRVDGSSRSVVESNISLYALGPPQVGYTIKEKPILYWYQSGPCQAGLEIVIIGSDKTKPILKIKQSQANKSGIQSLRLADHNVRLSKGVQYTWYVAIVPEENDRSKDIFASAMIEVIDPPLRVINKLMTVQKKELVYLLAEEGIWYDALDAISSLVESNSDDKELRGLRADLLEEGELSEVAKFARTHRP